MEAAQQTTAPMMMAAAGPMGAPLPIRSIRKKAENTIVVIVTPEIGLLLDPTRPAMYPATAEKANPAMSMSTAIVMETGISEQRRGTRRTAESPTGPSG